MSNTKTLKQLAQAATPGPWYVDDVRNEGSYGGGPDAQTGFRSYAIAEEKSGLMLFDTLNSDACTVEVDDDGAWDSVGQRNAAFVAAANPAAVLALIASHEQLVEAAVEMIRTGLFYWDHPQKIAADKALRNAVALAIKA